MKRASEYRIIVRGAGDIATGSIARLFRAGFRPIVLDIAKPSAIRRTVAFCEAVYEVGVTIEGIPARLAESLDDAIEIAANNEVPVLIDEEGRAIAEYRPDALIDAILAKRNLGTSRDMAPLTIALGPGFIAGEDCDFVIETMRGHNLGRIINQGTAMANTGTPGVIAGYGKERVIHAPASGVISNINKISDVVEQGEIIAYITQENGERVPVPASIRGLLRGIIRGGYEVSKGLKIADIDPRLEEYDNCFTISDKALAIGGSVLEIITADYFRNN